MKAFPFTADEYAASLEKSLLAAFAQEPDRFDGIASWEELHDVCDANEFVIDADESFGFHFPKVDSPQWEQYMAIVDGAIRSIEVRIFPFVASK